MTKTINFIIMCSLMLCLILPAFCTDNQVEQPSFLKRPVSITLKSDDQENMDKMSHNCNVLLSQLENDYSSEYQGSKINELNQFAGKRPVKVNIETIELIKWSEQLAEISKGTYDITTAAFLWLYGFGQKDYRVPTFYHLDVVKPLVNHKLIMVDNQNKAILFKRDGVQIDINPLLTAVAFEKLINLLKKNKIKEATCQIGQSYLVIGKKTGKKMRQYQLKPTWKSGMTIKPIFFQEGQLLVHDIYDQSFTEKGVLYHRLLDPKTGNSFQYAKMAVVYSPEHELITLPPVVLLTMKPENAIDLVNQEKNLACLIIDKENKVHYSKKWSKWIK